MLGMMSETKMREIARTAALSVQANQASMATQFAIIDASGAAAPVLAAAVAARAVSDVVGTTVYNAVYNALRSNF
jgi:hypothetical protein